jgi:hypothetical protein
MRKHETQIKNLNENMRKPKAWVFTGPRKQYPIDVKYIKERTKLLRNILNKNKHKNYGSTSEFSFHTEIKIAQSKYPNTWYLHYHVISGGMTDLRLMRHLWGSQILYEDAIAPKNLAFYVSKYASKVPTPDNLDHFLQYAQAVYKLKMHEFSTRGAPPPISPWILLENKLNNSTTMTNYELQQFFVEYANQYGFGG